VDVSTLKQAAAGDNGAAVYVGSGVRADASDCMVAVDSEGTSVGCVGPDFDYNARPRVIQGVLRPSGDIEVIIKAAPGFTTAQAGSRTVTGPNAVYAITVPAGTGNITLRNAQGATQDIPVMSSAPPV
jgi:hypothetical protein